MIKIIPRIFGGLGNQLFCYAAARRLALVSNGELIIDHVSGFVRDYSYKRHYQLDHFNIPCRKANPSERLEPYSRARRFLKRSWNRLLPFSYRKYIQQAGIKFEPRLVHLKPYGTIYLEGYWQSEDYFKDVETTIRQDLEIIAPTDHTNSILAEQILGTNSVGVHFRFFDEPKTPGFNNTPCDYYSRAISEIECRVSDPHYFLFSDFPEAALSILPLPDERVTLVSHNKGDENAYADLWLMSQCQHFIIANSTFSWWGAWLGRADGKIVIAPGFKKEDGKMLWGFEGLLPERWIKL